MPGRFPDVPAAVSFWRVCWEAVKLTERYVPLDGLDSYAISRTVSGELLRPMLEADVMSPSQVSGTAPR